MALKIYFDDKQRLVEENNVLLEKYKMIRAAGGLVVDDEGKILMIFRRGKWDLPKGKFEDGETLEECAKREVIEETGLATLDLKTPLLVTYHTYAEKKGLYLKETHWFLFEAPGKQELVPQTEEDISKIDWVNPADIKDYISNTYGLIKDVLEKGGYL